MAQNNRFNSVSGNERFKPNGSDLYRACGSQRDLTKSITDVKYDNLYPLTKDSSVQPMPTFPFASPNIDGAFVDMQTANQSVQREVFGIPTFSSSTSHEVQEPLSMFQPPPLPVFPSLIPPFPIPPFPPFPAIPHYPLPPPDSIYPSGTPTFSHPPPLQLGGDNSEKSIEKWFDLYKRNFEGVEIPCKNVNIKISDFKRKVSKLFELIGNLENLTTRLQVMSKSLDDEDWQTRKAEILSQKKMVQDAIEDLRDIPEHEIHLLLKRRKSKRNRLRKKKEEYRELKRENKALCQLEHSRIDLWLEKMKGLVEKARRDEDIKKQADYVLSEVFHKKSEAKRMLSLLTALGKLRNARIHDRESKGEFVSKEAATTFNSIIEKLKKRWIDQIKGYNIEEKGLRVMLTDAEVKRNNVELSLKKQIHQQWLELLFGVSLGKDNLQPNSFDRLVTIREDWDRFVVDGDFISSSIPNGWVVPVPPTNDVWATFIKK